MLKRNIRLLSKFEVIALGFMIVICVGTILLMLPVSSLDYVSTPFQDALFTATSATCVTGLIVYDTATKWSLFGQIVILMLIQIGGLGFITIGVFLSTFLQKKISLRQRSLVEESMNTLKISGGVLLVKRVIKGTLLFEGIGAVLLSSVFIRDFGIQKGIYYGIFHSISAFCNAGFDLMGVMEPYGSLTRYSQNGFVLCVIMALIIIGGIGFVVWEDVYTNKFKIKKYSLQTKIVFSTTISLIVGGAILFGLFERNGALASMNAKDWIINSLFQSVTCRTAGFNSVDTSHLSDGALNIMTILMFIGGSPGSTAGGIKTTSFTIIFLFVISTLLNQKDVNVFQRRISDELIKKAFAVFFINLTLVIIGLLFISIVQPELSYTELIFEVVSAIGTVGISTGITRSLNVFSKYVIIFLMYAGRIGTLTFALMFTAKKKEGKIQKPLGKVAIG